MLSTPVYNDNDETLRRRLRGENMRYLIKFRPCQLSLCSRFYWLFLSVTLSSILHPNQSSVKRKTISSCDTRRIINGRRRARNVAKNKLKIFFIQFHLGFFHLSHLLTLIFKRKENLEDRKCARKRSKMKMAQD